MRLAESIKSDFSVFVEREQTPGAGDFVPRSLVTTLLGRKTREILRTNFPALREIGPCFSLATSSSEIERDQVLNKPGLSALVEVDLPHTNIRLLLLHNKAQPPHKEFVLIHNINLLKSDLLNLNLGNLDSSGKIYYELGKNSDGKAMRLGFWNPTT